MKRFRYTYFRNLQAAGDERPVPYEVLVAAPTKKAALDLLGITDRELGNYGGPVTNEADAAALDAWPPGTLLARRLTHRDRALRPFEDVMSEHEARRLREQHGESGDRA